MAWYSLITSPSALACVTLAATTIYLIKNTKCGTRSLPDVRKYYIPETIEDEITPIRPLGLEEQWYTASHNTGIYCCVGFIAQLEGKIPSQNHMLCAAEELIRKHPQLRTATIDTNRDITKGPSYIFWINKIDLPSAFRKEHRSNPNTWKEVFLKEQHIPFVKDFSKLDKSAVKQSGIPPFFKLVLVASDSDSGPFEIFFGVHHAIADGMAGIYLFRDFLDILDKAIKSNTAPVGLNYQVDPRVQKSLPVDLLLDVRPAMWELIRVLVTDAIPFLRKKSAWRGPPHLKSTHRTSNTVLVQIPKSQTDTLLHQCRSQGATLNAVLFAASHFAIVKLLNQYPVISSETACNLRPFCQPKLPPNSVGTFVCGPETEYAMDSKMQFWKFVLQTKKDYTAVIEKSYRRIGMVSFVDLHQYFDKKKKSEPNGRQSTFSLSNLGSIPFPDSFQMFTMQGCYFSNVKNGEGPVFMISVVTVHGSLHLAVSYVEQIITRDHAETFTKHLLEVLDRCGKQFSLQDFLA